MKLAGIARTIGAAVGLLAMGMAPQVSAQVLQPTPPEHYTLDPRGVDLVTGQFATSASDVVIGQPGQGGIAFGRIWANGGWRDNLAGTIAVSGSTYTVSFNGISEQFTLSGSTFTPVSNTGSTLTQSGSTLTYTSADGTVATYSTIYSGSTSPYAADNAAIMSLQQADGQKLDWYWNGITYCAVRVPVNPDDPPGECLVWRNAVRPEAIRNNQGYQIKFLYALDTVPDGPIELAEGWLNRTGVVGVNLAVDHCQVGAGPCSGLTRTWPSAAYVFDLFAGGVTQVTDQSSRTTTYTYSADGLATIRYPGATVDDVAITYSGGKVSQVSDASGAWAYSYADAGSTRTTTSTGPSGEQLVAVADLTIGRATSIAVKTSATPTTSTTTYQYDGQRRLERITNPEGDYTQYTFDGRGNVVTTTSVPKSGSGLANIVTSAAYPASCVNPRTCNRPTSTTDARGNVTDYTWNATHGGLESVTLPAPSSGADRPQTRIAYANQTAWFKVSGPTIVAASSSVSLPVSTSACASGTAPSCLGTANETKTTIVYGSSGVANNLLPTSTTSGDGTGGLAATTAMTWTPDGDPATVDGPLAGAADTTRMIYDTARQTVGVIGPDPDGGGGALLNRAQRMTYNPRGQVTLVEAGTTPGQSDSDWAGFSTLQRQATEYDALGRPVVARAQDAGGTTLALQQFGYDPSGRPSCAATRMNPAHYAGLPGSTSACTLTGLGGYGPDRIVQTNYDLAGRPVSTVSGLGTGSTITESVSYTANGQAQSLTDGRGNVSILVYDGFNRPSRLRYPDPATPGVTSTTDYEEYGYDAASNVVSMRNRAGQTFARWLDNLGRVGSVLSADSPATIPQRYYAYDNLNRPLYAHTPTATPWAVYWGWDALNRKTYEQVADTSAAATTTVWYGYDLGGRRTWIVWPDSNYASYEYNYGDDLTVIRENGGTALATFGYDNLGRRLSVNRPNGTNTSYLYDGLSRLSAMTHDLLGTGSDVSYAYGYNPAGQIMTRSVSNGTYVHGPASGSISYANNGLNQVTNVGGSGVVYDGGAFPAKGNITSVAGNAYGYDGLSQLTSATPSGGSPTALTYDPTSRLFSAASGATRFLYDGAQVIGEYDGSGNMTARYVPGVGLDDVVTSYAGSGLSSPSWLLADERGSVVGLTNGSGAATATNTYDEYGVPGSSNAGRFQYTGQMWLPDVGLYHYRARAYEPQLGRFLQTDPIGYAGGANLYAYVGSDPINLVDALGLQEHELQVPVAWLCSRSGPPGDTGRYFNGCVTTEYGYINLSAIWGRQTQYTGGGGGGGGGGGVSKVADEGTSGGRLPLPPGIRIPGGNPYYRTPAYMGGVPYRVRLIAQIIRTTGQPITNTRGGQIWANDGRGGGQVLPRVGDNGNAIVYREYDVNPYRPGVNRGPERIVSGTDGSTSYMYYTSDHYRTFTPIW